MNVLKDPDFLFTLLASIMKREGGVIKILEKDLLAVDMTEAVALHYNQETGTITLKFISAEQLTDSDLFTKQLTPEDKLSALGPPALRLVPELEENGEE
jgi:hypothetical protein|tara:strand:+ start:166 stop:462 length:297 start_codon:yes stop_codon:yes gene_type:complete